MTKNSDEMAFYEWSEKYWRGSATDREAWQAAIEFERKRSEKLVEALYMILAGNPEDIGANCMQKIAAQAIKDYKENLWVVL